ncbi:hypothetical protein [Agromyces humatus]|uniref:Uncharacterized protein n=1 Tax=Agromyces humatus TaxID=279573 RepID=A0ABP4X7C0_9MICO|nr:hypothetical protein [Agromyces humatus]
MTRFDDEITDAEFLAMNHRRIDCPLSWCRGRYLDHGGDGAEPDAWVHEGEDIKLGSLGSAAFIRVGAGPVRLAMSLELRGEFDVDGLQAIAADLHGIQAWTAQIGAILASDPMSGALE